MTKNNSFATIVLGASPNPSRYAFLATKKLLEHNIKTYPVGIRKGKCAELDIINTQDIIPEIHTITLYLGADIQANYYDYILATKPERVIFNPGTENPELIQLLRSKLPSCKTEHACTLVMLNLNSFKM